MSDEFQGLRLAHTLALHREFLLLIQEQRKEENPHHQGPNDKVGLFTVNYLQIVQTSDQCTSWLHLVESQAIPGTGGRTHTPTIGGEVEVT